MIEERLWCQTYYLELLQQSNITLHECLHHGTLIKNEHCLWNLPEAQTSTATNIEILLKVIEIIPAIFMTCVFSPLSNIKGRKFLMISSLLGTVIEIIICYALLQIDNLKVEYFLLAGIPNIFGGPICFFVGMLSYACDLNEEDKRNDLIRTAEGAYGSGMMLAITLGDEMMELKC